MAVGDRLSNWQDLWGQNAFAKHATIASVARIAAQDTFGATGVLDLYR